MKKKMADISSTEGVAIEPSVISFYVSLVSPYYQIEKYASRFW